MALYSLGLNYPPLENWHGGYRRPFSDLNHAAEGHLLGPMPQSPSLRSACPSPTTLVHPPWVPPGTSPRPKASPPARSAALSATLSPDLSTQLQELARSLSLPPSAGDAPAQTSPPLRASAGSGSLGGSSRALRPPPSPPRGLFSTTATLCSPSPDPFLLPAHAASAALAPLRLHLCPSQALVRALASAARATTGFLTQSDFSASVCAWDAAAAAQPPAPPPPLLAALFALLAREAHPTSRSWHAGHASLDFRLLAAALLPCLPLTPAPARLELLWSLYEPAGLSPRQLISVCTAVAAGRVALALDAALASGEGVEDCWRVRGSIERHARALAGAAFEDSKVAGGRMTCAAFQQWLSLRRVALF